MHIQVEVLDPKYFRRPFTERVHANSTSPVECTIPLQLKEGTCLSYHSILMISIVVPFFAITSFLGLTLTRSTADAAAKNVMVGYRFAIPIHDAL
jgi:hypothetical protein